MIVEDAKAVAVAFANWYEQMTGPDAIRNGFWRSCLRMVL